MGEESIVSNSYVFRGMEYIVSMAVEEQQGSLTVEVEDRLTSDQWRGTFDATYIEDLTHKTGNFKQFSIFVNMLESAIVKASESVTLDLLTYADLESLRNRKAGAGSRSNIPGAQKAALSTKRYLIVTYTVEFDRIHYPLPLPYQGKPDPVALQETVRELKAEIKKLKAQFHSNFKTVELQKLKKDYEDLLQEKQHLEDAFLNFRREVKNTTKGSAVKEVHILKNVVRNLEEELVNEKRKHQRSANKRNQEYKALLEEVEELRASDRNLRVRVKSLTNELAVLRRTPSSRRTSRSPSAPPSNHRSSVPRRALSTHERARIASRDRSLSKERPWSGSRDRHRSSSRERGDAGLRNRLHSGSRDRSRDRLGSAGKDRRRPPLSSSYGRGTPSPAGVRKPRFDPSAFIEDKRRRQEEAKLKRERSRRRTFSNGSQPGSQERGRTRTRPSPSYQGYSRTRSRSSSAGSVGSRRSSAGLSDVDVLSDASQARRQRLKQVLKPGRTSSSTAWNSPNVPYRGKGSSSKGRRMMSTPDPDLSPDRARRVVNSGKVRRKELNEYGVTDDPEFYNRSAEMSEIDARLNALQHFMKTNIP
ncbi:centrosomal protein CCDC61-like [Amphiura filiformis]|uniref:centrosomal protein CCDC61-like n=1 Tax=Amphiura filiformis TaxID=82378 RepID=UPI003B21DD83